MRARLVLPFVVLAILACSSDDNGSAGPSAPPNNPGTEPPGNPGTGGTPGASATVSVGDDFFSPSAVTVQRSSGTATVRWTWAGYNLHSVVFDVGGPSAPPQSSGTFEREFTTAGQFTYFCTVHGRSVMSGTVTVQ